MINGTGDGGSSFAVEAGGGSDWEEPIFLDRAKQGRGWQRPGFIATPSANLDSEGALASLPAGDTTQNYFFSAYRDGNGVHVGTQPDRSGRFRVTITGGSSSLGGAGITNITQINATTWEFDCDYIGNKFLTFTPTAFPIKVAIVKTTDLAAHGAGGIFRQEYLDNLPSGGCFRFMGAMGTNDSPVVNLADYPVASSQKWNRAPISVLTALCNMKSADPWICIPHQATDALVTNWATYLRDNLNSSLRIRVELSNEIWNTGSFTQGSYFKAQAESVWGVADGYSNNIYLHYAGKRFAQIMAIFNSVFAGQTNRLIGVIGAQAASTTTATAMADATQWQTFEPGSYVAPRTLARELSIAPYINYTGTKATTAQNIKTQLDISVAAASSHIKTVLTPAGLTQSKGWIDAYVPIASSRNLRLTMYEYNNHFDLFYYEGTVLYSSPGVPVAGALDAFIDATYSQEMADAQDELRTHFKARNGSLMSFFVAVSRASRFGTWGAKTHLEHNSAIWNDLVSWHTANPRWWAR